MPDSLLHPPNGGFGNWVRYREPDSLKKRGTTMPTKPEATPQETEYEVAIAAVGAAALVLQSELVPRQRSTPLYAARA